MHDINKLEDNNNDSVTTSPTFVGKIVYGFKNFNDEEILNIYDSLQERIEQMAETSTYVNKLELIKRNLALDILIKDDNRFIRAAVAKQGYGLNRLINDEDINVKLAAKVKLEEELDQNKNKIVEDNSEWIKDATLITQVGNIYLYQVNNRLGLFHLNIKTDGIYDSWSRLSSIEFRQLQHMMKVYEIKRQIQKLEDELAEDLQRVLK